MHEDWVVWGGREGAREGGEVRKEGWVRPLRSWSSPGAAPHLSRVGAGRGVMSHSVTDAL